jgi:hypothetical protein
VSIKCLLPTFTIYQRKKGEDRWELCGTEAYFSRSDAEYLIQNKYQPEHPDREYEARLLAYAGREYAGVWN